MAKPWSQVELSKEFLNLSPQNRVQAKREYWESVVLPKTQFKSLPPESQAQAKQEFFGGRPIADVPEKEFAKPSIPIETAAGTAETIGRSGLELAKGIVTPFIHPIETAKAIGGTGVGLAQKLIPGRQAQERYPEAIAEQYKKRYGSVEGIAETVATDPAGFLADVALVGGATGAGLKQVGKLSKIKAVEQAGKFPVVAKTAQEVAEAVKTTKPFKAAFPTKAKKVDTAIEIGVNKGIRPTVRGKKTMHKLEKAKTDTNDAIKTIVENKKNLRLVDQHGQLNRSGLPESIAETVQSVDQTKKLIFNQYDDLIKKTGKGTLIQGKDAIRELNKVIKAKENQIRFQDFVREAKKAKQEIIQAGPMTATQANELMTKLNNRLAPFYKNKTFADSSKAAVDAMVADGFRKELNNIVSKATGRDFGGLKKQYGSLLALEKEVNHRLIVDSRKAFKGFFDITDVFSDAQIARGLITADPGALVQGITQRTVKGFIKSVNDPNNIVKKMFKEVDKYHDPRPPVINPEILTDLPFSTQKAIGKAPFIKPRALPQDRIKALPDPRKAPYIPTGRRTPEVKKIITPVTESKEVIIAPNPVKKLPYTKPIKGKGFIIPYPR